MLLKIKPLSVNDAWKGRRFKTNAYKNYEKAVLLMLPKMEVPGGDLKIELTFGFSNKASDIDNPVKCFVDCLQKKYGFNDSRVYEMSLKKCKVKKGHEFIDFEISQLV